MAKASMKSKAAIDKEIAKDTAVGGGKKALPVVKVPAKKSKAMKKKGSC